MPSFSERQGFTWPKAIQRSTMDVELRNSIWNICLRRFFTQKRSYTREEAFRSTAYILYVHFYKLPTDDIPTWSKDFVDSQKKYILNSNWYRIYDLLEFMYNISSIEERVKLTREFNSVFEIEKSAYRFISGKIAPIVDKHELAEIDRSIEQEDRFFGVSEHIKTALSMYAAKPSPDYRNSIKESISAVESAARIIANDPSATLGEALKKINLQQPIHQAMMKGFLSLYGYTSDEGGIRHSMLNETNVSEADARYMLVCCSAFANYLISRSGN